MSTGSKWINLKTASPTVQAIAIVFYSKSFDSLIFVKTFSPSSFFVTMFIEHFSKPVNNFARKFTGHNHKESNCNHWFH